MDAWRPLQSSLETYPRIRRPVWDPSSKLLRSWDDFSKCEGSGCKQQRYCHAFSSSPDSCVWRHSWQSDRVAICHSGTCSWAIPRRGFWWGSDNRGPFADCIYHNWYFYSYGESILPTPGRLVTAPGIPDRCDDFSTLSTSVVIAPFKIEKGEVLKSTSSPSVADFMGAILDMWYEASQVDDTPPLPKVDKPARNQPRNESKGLLTCQQLVLVLWHWNFSSRNVLVDRRPDTNWEITAVLDWDGALCVPRMLTREPPVLLW